MYYFEFADVKWGKRRVLFIDIGIEEERIRTMDPRDNINIPEKELNAFSRKWSICEISFFGSVLTPGFNPESDIDVIVSFTPGTRYSLLDLVRMENELKELLGRDVDLVTKASIESSRNYIRKKAILSSMETIYVAG